MLQLKKPTSLICIAILILGFACRTEVPHEFPAFEQTPVINAVFTADSTMWVHVSFAQSMGNEPITTIANAQVCVFANNVCIDTLQHSANGMYVSDSTTHAGLRYVIKVLVPNYDTVTATQIVPLPSHIKQSAFVPVVSRNEEGHVAGFDVTITNTPGILSYYLIRCFGYSYGNYREIDTYFFEDDPSFIAEGIPSGVVSNSMFVTDSLFTIRLAYQQGRYYDQFQLYQIQLHHISYDYYQYMRSSYLYQKNRYPEFSFGGVTPYNLYTNTSIKHGVFLSSSVIMTDTVRIYNNYNPF